MVDFCMGNRESESIFMSIPIVVSRRCRTHARGVVCQAMRLSGAALFHLSQHIAIDTDTRRLSL